MQTKITISGLLAFVVMTNSVYAAEPSAPQLSAGMQPKQLAKEAMMRKGPIAVYVKPLKTDQEAIAAHHGPAKSREFDARIQRAQEHQAALEQATPVQHMLNDYEWALAVLQAWFTNCRTKGPKKIINDSFADCRKKLESKKQ